jgi:enoyl-CoA hydratase/carnithine racemase
MSTTPSAVIMAVDRQVAVLTLSHPPANTLSRGLLLALQARLETLARDETVRAVVITGSGRFFSAGADLKELSALRTAEECTAFARLGQKMFNRIADSTKPVIAAINGVCVGGGLELAMACHVRIAAADAVLGLPEIKLGVIPGFGGTQRLPSLVGRPRAAEMILSGDSIPGDRAAAWGLVNRAVPASDVLTTAVQFGAKVAAGSRTAVEAALAALRSVTTNGGEDGFAREAELFGSLADTPDKREGIAAFLEKRQVRFG